MLILASFRASVDSTALPAGVYADLTMSVDGDSDHEDLVVSVEPRVAGAGRQAAWIALRHGTRLYYEDRFTSGPSVGLDVDGHEFEFSNEGVRGDYAAGDFGLEVDRGVAPPGSDPIAISIITDFNLDEPGTEIEDRPLITDGRVWESSRSLIGGEPMELSGEGYLSRFDGEITYIKRAGTAKKHGQVIVEILESGGVPRERIDVDPELGYDLLGPLEVSCDNPIDAARDVAEAFGHVLVETGTGAVAARPIAPVDEPPIITLGVEDLALEPKPTLRQNARNIPLCYLIEGQRPELPNSGDGFVTTRRLESETVETLVPTYADFDQDSAGNLSARTNPVAAQELITQQVWVEETFFRGCLARLRRETWERFNPEIHRYITANGGASQGTADGEPRTYPSAAFVFGSTAVKDDSSPARLWHVDRLVPVSIEQQDYFRDEPPLAGAPRQDSRGVLLKVTSSTGGWRSIEAATKSRGAVSDPWDAENVRPNIKYFAGGRMIDDQVTGGLAEEVLFCGPLPPDDASQFAEFDPGFNGAVCADRWLSQSVVEISVIDNQGGGGDPARPSYSETKREEVATGFARAPGELFLFADNVTGGGQGEEGRVTERISRPFTTERGGSSHSEQVIERDDQGNRFKTPTNRNIPGFLPDADLCTEETLNSESTQPVIGQHCLAPVSAEDVSGRTESKSFDFGVENAAAATDLALQLHRVATAFEVEAELPLTSIFRPKTPIRFRDLRGQILGFGDGTIDPDAYPHASNAWVESVVVEATRDESAGVRKTVKIIISVAQI